MDKKWTFSTCCNPFDKAKHSSVRRGLRPVMQWMCRKLPQLPLEGRVCDTCRKNIASLEDPSSSSPDSCSEFVEEKVLQEQPSCSQELSVQEDEDLMEIHQHVALSTMNASLLTLGESPIIQSKLTQEKYPKEKLKRVHTALKRKLLFSDSEDSSSSKRETDTVEIISQLKEKFHSTTNRSVKIQVLTVLPASWSVKKTEQEFGASNRMVRMAKKLVKDKGILSTPNQKPGKPLSENIVELVKKMYESDDVSRSMPGKKDYVSVKVDGKRVHIQKRLVLCNLKEIHCLFKEKYPQHPIGFSKFAELRPKNCVLPGASRTHAVCVCTIHQNVKLMLLGAKLSELTVGDDIYIKTYHHCVAQMICNPPQEKCFLHECQYCPGTLSLKEHLSDVFEEEMIEDITYKQWVSTDRCSLETLTKSVEDFLETLCEKLDDLLRHSFIATQQSSFQSKLKLALLPGEYLVVCDFAENYSFVLQDEAQGFHWNNSSATIHPFVIYFNEDGKEQHISFVVISESLQHDTVAVHLFIKKMVNFLLVKFELVNKIFYFSDGAAAQYKNRKNFVNLCYHATDFSVEAEWHFSATSHGKGACDGVGGTVKRLAARASLQRPYESQIMTPRQLHDWAKQNIPSVSFEYCTSEEHILMEKTLETRFSQSRPIPGTQKLHSFKPLSQTKVLTRVYSFSMESKEELVSTDNETIEFDNIKGFVTCVYGGEWWPACVIETFVASKHVKLSFLHPSGPNASFTYPSQPDILTTNATNILTAIDPRTATGRVYTLTVKESEEASQKLLAWKMQN